MAARRSILMTLFIITLKLVNGYINLSLNHPLQQRNQSFFNLSEEKGYWIELPLDHFDVNEKRTFKIRYFERLNYWQTNGPIYIYVDKQSLYNLQYSKSLLNELAKNTNGVLFSIEYRYSEFNEPRIPINNLIKYYKFLSAEQALADLAHFIKVVKADPKYKWSKVVVIGAGLAGNIAAWSRARYPELVDAALAASAPVLAKKDFHEYYDGIRYTYEKYGTENCLKQITSVFKHYEELLKTDKGMDTLKNELNYCPSVDLTMLENQQLLFMMLYKELYFNALFSTPDDIKEYCEDINSDNSKLWLFRSPQGQSCSLIDYYLLIHGTPELYQSCSEHGQFLTTSSEKQPFVHWNPLEFFFKMCEEIFDKDIEKRIDEGIARTNEMFGGRSPNVTKAVFTHGDMDPWHRLGVLRDLGPDAPVLIANGTSHAAILFVRENDSKELIEQRKRTEELIKKWIS